MTDSQPQAPQQIEFRRRGPLLSRAVVATLVIVSAVFIGGGIYIHFFWFDKQPWRIDYPGVTWVTHTETYTTKDQPCFVAEVRFDTDVLSAAEFQDFLKKLVSATPGLYVYYDIYGFNKRNICVIRGTVQTGRNERFGITPTDQYDEQ